MSELHIKGGGDLELRFLRLCVDDDVLMFRRRVAVRSEKSYVSLSVELVRLWLRPGATQRPPIVEGEIASFFF